MQARHDTTVRALGLLLLSAFCAPAFAVEPPAGTVTALNDVGLFDGSQDLLESCVALQNADGSAQLDANGTPRMFAVVLSLDRATLTFTLLARTPFDAGTGKDCSGVYRNGIYSDAVLITNLSPYYDGSVWNLTMDYVPGAELAFRLRVDSSFSAVRNFAGNTTQLGASLGDFAQNSVREYGSANLAPTITMRLPECNDPQGDENRVMVVRNGTGFAAASPGATFGWSTAGLTVGDYTFQAYCSDQFGLAQLANALGLTLSPSAVATSSIAPGTLTIRIVTGSTPEPEPSDGALNFNFAATTSDSDQQLIRDTAEFAQDFLLTTFGRTLRRNTTISTLGQSGGCTNAGASAFTGPQTMTICIANRGWTDHGPVNRRKILIHELFHLLQFELGWLGGAPGAVTGPHWLIEGSAEYVGWLGVESLGDVSLDIARGCMLKEVADFGVQQPPGLPNLDQLETRQSFGRPGPVYPLSMLGVDQLVAGSSTSALLTYGNAVVSSSDWVTGFNAAFGTTPAAFYSQFTTHLVNSSVPPTYLCRI